MPANRALPKCVATMIRMEHPECVAAVTLDAGFPIEIGLLPPGVLGTGWAVTLHHDCDPEHPTRGSSGVENFDTREEAEARFREEASDPRANRVLIRYCAVGKRKDGKPAFLHNDGTGIAFVEAPDQATLVMSATGAALETTSAPKFSRYHGADKMDLGSFQVHRVDILTRRVPVDAAVRTTLEARDSAPPEGWAFLVADADTERFAAPRNNWSADTDIAGAVSFNSLRDAVARLDKATEDGWHIVLGRRSVNQHPLVGASLDTLVAHEAEVKAYVAPPADLSHMTEFRPFG